MIWKIRPAYLKSLGRRLGAIIIAKILNREGVTTYSNSLYSLICVFQHTLRRAEFWSYAVFRCAHRGNLRGVKLRLCRSMAGLYPLPRRAWHLSASNQHYAVLCDGFSFAEPVARILEPCTRPNFAFHGTRGLCLSILYANYSGMRIRCSDKCRQRE